MEPALLPDPPQPPPRAPDTPVLHVTPLRGGAAWGAARALLAHADYEGLCAELLTPRSYATMLLDDWRAWKAQQGQGQHGQQEHTAVSAGWLTAYTHARQQQQLHAGVQYEWLGLPHARTPKELRRILRHLLSLAGGVVLPAGMLRGSRQLHELLACIHQVHTRAWASAP